MKRIYKVIKSHIETKFDLFVEYDSEWDRLLIYDADQDQVVYLEINPKYKNHVGIHIETDGNVNDLLWAIEDRISVAFRDNFPAIFVHSA